MADSAAELRGAADRRGRATARTARPPRDKDLLHARATCPTSLRTRGRRAAAGRRGQPLPVPPVLAADQVGDTPYLVGGAKVIGGGPTGYMLKSLATERRGPQLAGLVAGDRHRARAGRLGAAGAGRRDDRAEAGAAAGRRGAAARRGASWTPGCGCPARTNWPISPGRSTARRSRWRSGSTDLSAREEASRRFVADMSHELRTPLTAITAVTEVLEEEARLASTR